MDWSKGYSSSYYITVVDPYSWGDTERYEITSGSIEHTVDNLLSSADVECVRYAPEKEQIIRIWLDARQGGESSHIPLFTGYTSSPEKNINGLQITYPLQCYSILKKAEDVMLERGWYILAGENGAEVAASLLKVVGTPITVEESTTMPELKTSIVAEDDESNLSMAWNILTAINWRMTLDGYGRIYIGPYSDDEMASYDARHNDIIEPSITITNDWYECPNVYQVITDTGESYTARDEDAESIYSIPSRGREIWSREVDVSLGSFDSPESYAKRQLKNAQQLSTTVSYTKRFDPDVQVSDVIRLHYPDQDITGRYMVKSQSIELGHGGKTSEEVVKLYKEYVNGVT